MGTTYYPCGCSITRSMFGNQELVSVNPCYKHAIESQNELKALSDRILELFKKENNGNKEKSNN